MLELVATNEDKVVAIGGAVELVMAEVIGLDDVVGIKLAEDSEDGTDVEDCGGLERFVGFEITEVELVIDCG